MKIILNQQQCDLTQHCRQAEKNLREQPVLVLCSNDYLEHIATYLVWLQQGGNIFVKAPGLPDEQDRQVMSALHERTLTDSLVFHTSGTTGHPKLVVNHLQQIKQACEMSTQALDWNSKTNFLTFVPPYTTGFWHIILPATVEHQSTLTIGHREQAVKDLNHSGCNSTILVPGLINRLKTQRGAVDLSGYQTVGVGASQVNLTHVNYVFDHGAQSLAHLYGASEICSPILSRTTTRRDDHSEWLNLACHGQNQTQLIDNELWVKGPSVCSNYQEFEHHEEWIKTGDLWEQHNDLVRFIGRTNDLVKINGFKTNLLFIESVIEERSDLGECLAIPRHSAGVDWIELLYTNIHARPDRNAMKHKLKSILSACNIPKKYTLVDQIAKNNLGKKIRHA